MKRMLLFFATLWLGIMVASAQKYHYDVNNDGGVNISDAVAVVNKILGKENPGEVVVGEAVDLGLPSGTLWSSCNIGASSPEEYGNYYAWGETKTKSEYSKSTYQFYQNGYVDIGTDISGTEYDVATVLWGDGWRMPTKEEIQELMNNCTSEWTTLNGVNGRKFSSKTNGNSIFLPATGYRQDGNLKSAGEYGLYRSSALLPNRSDYTSYLCFNSGNAYWVNYLRENGLSVRPVRPGNNSVPATAVDLGLPSGTMWASHNVGASSPEECGNYYAWGETEVKNEYVFENYTHIDEYESICKDIGSNISGTKYDVAHVNWGGNWRMPTEEEVNELFENCSFKWTKYNGVDGGLFTGPNGNSVFLPAGGRFYGTEVDWRNGGCYWAGTEDTMGECAAVDLCFGQGGVEWYSGAERDFGFLVRPVNAPLPSNIVVHEAVDLGLPSGTKWASCNVGATKPEEYGGYFAWGELGGKKEYTQENYQFYVNNEYKYLGDDISGTKYDVAHQRWGGGWRMPTREEFEELMDNCTSEWTTLNGVNGRKFTSKTNDKSIFLPAAGGRSNGNLFGAGDNGGYRSSTQSPHDSEDAYNLDFDSGEAYWSSSDRASGLSVRPVVRD